MRRFVMLLCLLVMLAGVVRAEGGDTVTLPSGEVVTVTRTGSQTVITLPGGATVTRTQFGENSSAWSSRPDVSSADFDKAQQAYTLWEAGQEQPRQRTVPLWFALLLLAVGLFNLFAPHAAWYLNTGWKFKDAEPSKAAIFLGRAGGGIASAVGLGLLFFG